MAKIEGLLTEAQILGLKGVIDFYYFRGSVVARMWPTKRTIPKTEKEIEGQVFFGLVQNKIKNMCELNRDEWRKFVAGNNIVWTDAIRMFHLTNNPDRELFPNFYFDHYEIHTDSGYYWISWFINKDCDAAEPVPRSRVSFDYDDDPQTPITWQSVGIKRRRRAIQDKKIRPAFTGFNNGSFRWQEHSETQWKARARLPWKRKYLSYAVYSGTRPKPDSLYTPIYNVELDWDSAPVRDFDFP